MSDQPGGTFRGRIPGEGKPGASSGPESRGEAWGWSRVTDNRRPVPWFGVFLILFGGLLLIEQFIPGARAVGSGLVVAVGVALLMAWLVNRKVWQLYAGAILTAASLPSLLQDLDAIRGGPGWGTLFLGIALLAIALIRGRVGSGIRWQLVLGVILAAVGGAQVAEREIPNFPSVTNLLWPAFILLVGLILVLRALRGRSRPQGQ